MLHRIKDVETIYKLVVLSFGDYYSNEQPIFFDVKSKIIKPFINLTGIEFCLASATLDLSTFWKIFKFDSSLEKLEFYRWDIICDPDKFLKLKKEWSSYRKDEENQIQKLVIKEITFIALTIKINREEKKENEEAVKLFMELLMLIVWNMKDLKSIRGMLDDPKYKLSELLKEYGMDKVSID